MAGEKKTAFTQDDVNAAVARARRGWDAEKAGLTQRLTELEASHVAASARAADLEKQLGATAQTSQQLTAERDEWRGKADSANAARRQDRLQVQIGEALVGARVLTSARGQALRAMLADAEFDQGDDGAVTAVRYGGKSYSDPGEAAAEFLKANDFLLSAGSPNGGGTRRPTSNHGWAPVQTPIEEQNPRELATRGMQAPFQPTHHRPLAAEKGAK